MVLHLVFTQIKKNNSIIIINTIKYYTLWTVRWQECNTHIECTINSLRICNEQTKIKLLSELANILNYVDISKMKKREKYHETDNKRRWSYSWFTTCIFSPLLPITNSLLSAVAWPKFETAEQKINTWTVLVDRNCSIFIFSRVCQSTRKDYILSYIIIYRQAFYPKIYSVWLFRIFYISIDRISIGVRAINPVILSTNQLTRILLS